METQFRIIAEKNKKGLQKAHENGLSVNLPTMKIKIFIIDRFPFTSVEKLFTKGVKNILFFPEFKFIPAFNFKSLQFINMLIFVISYSGRCRYFNRR